VIRPITAADFAIAREFLHQLSFGTRYFRFGRGDFVYSDDEIRALLQPDPARRVHLIAVAEVDGAETMLGSARYAVDPDRAGCRFALVVRDGCQHGGLGRRLMRALIATARAHGLRRMHGEVLGTNRAMLAFVAQLGFTPDPASCDAPVRRVTLALGD